LENYTNYEIPVGTLQLHEFPISSSLIHNFNFVISRFQHTEFVNLRFKLHEFPILKSRIPLSESRTREFKKKVEMSPPVFRTKYNTV
jgi:hypothetical protein